MPPFQGCHVTLLLSLMIFFLFSSLRDTLHASCVLGIDSLRRRCVHRACNQMQRGRAHAERTRRFAGTYVYIRSPRDAAVLKARRDRLEMSSLSFCVSWCVGGPFVLLVSFMLWQTGEEARFHFCRERYIVVAHITKLRATVYTRSLQDNGETYYTWMYPVTSPARL